MSSRRQRKNVQLSNEEDFDNLGVEDALDAQHNALSDQNHVSTEPDAIPRVEQSSRRASFSGMQPQCQPVPHYVRKFEMSQNDTDLMNDRELLQQSQNQTTDIIQQSELADAMSSTQQQSVTKGDATCMCCQQSTKNGQVVCQVCYQQKVENMQNELDKYKEWDRTKQYQLEQITQKYNDNLQQLSTQQHNNQLLTNQN